MSLSQSVADRSRNAAAARVFLPALTNPPTSPHSWKFALERRIWFKKEGPKGNAARSVLTVLLWNSDESGRTWLGIHAIMEHCGFGNERTVRKALDLLVNDGWVTFTAHTWSSLTAEQLATGHKAPRRGDVGQAPNLYTVLSSRSQPSRPDLPTRPNLAPPTESPVDLTPQHICQGGPRQICQGEPPADLPPDPDPMGSVSRIESAEGATRAPSTLLSSKAKGSQEDWSWLPAWDLLVNLHAEKTKSVYGIAPLPPDMKRATRKAVAECLEGTALDFAATLRARGIQRELAQVRQDLATRLMSLYFKHDNEHLRTVKHALRDLPREFHARISDAMNAISRESHDNVNVPGRTAPLEVPAQGVKAEKAAQVTKSEAAEKPLPQAMPANTARAARRLMEALSAAPLREEPSTPRQVEPSRATRPTQEAAGPESRQLQEANDGANAPQTIQRSSGRPGAPRWGALGPTPAKMRRVSRLQVAEPEQATESPEPHPRE